MTFAYNYIKDNGLETEEDYPYNAEDNECTEDSRKSIYKVTEYKTVD